MAHYGGLPPDVAFSSLHDDLLNDLHETVSSSTCVRAYASTEGCAQSLFP